MIKNSWGPNWWGYKGFGWIRYRSNNIGFGAAWVDAVKVTKSNASSEADLRNATRQAIAIGNKAIEQVGKEILGGPNSIFNNPGQILGGPNSAINKILRGF